jgi:hypothetical protein
MERHCKQQLHKKHALGSTKRGEAVKLTWDNIKDHTCQNEPEGSGSNSESEEEEERSSEKQMVAFYKDSNGAERAVVHATHVTTDRQTKAGNTLLVENNRLEFTQRDFPALRTIRVDQIDRGIMAFEHENFDRPLIPPAINFQTERHKKHVVSCVDDRANWAHLFFEEWASGLPAVEIQPSRPDTDVDCDTDEESDSSDSD